MTGCTIDGCDNAHRARGLCAMHWKREHGKPTRYRITCVACGTEHLSARPDGRYCSLWCRDAEARRRHLLPAPRVPHPRDIYQPTAPTLQRTWFGGTCAWCAAPFLSLQPRATHCSARCTRRAGKASRRAREHGAVGTYTWAEVIRAWLTLDKQCAYCRTRTDDIEPDHVEALSRGGSNSISNVVPCCSECNRDKRALSLTEWAADRERRGLTTRTLDPRCTYVTSTRPLAA